MRQPDPREILDRSITTIAHANIPFGFIIVSHRQLWVYFKSVQLGCKYVNQEMNAAVIYDV